MPDIRLDCSFLTHPKRQKLQRRLGPAGVMAFIDLLLWISQDTERSQSGTLKCMDHEDIAIAAGWGEGPDKLLEALVAVRLLDEVEDHYVIHNWPRRQAYLAMSSKRSERARAAAKARWESMHQAPKNDAGSMPDACSEHAQTKLEDAPDPTRPDPTKEKRSVGVRCNIAKQVHEVIAYYQSLHPRALRNVKANSKIYRTVASRLHDGYTAADICKAIDGNHISPFHRGDNATGTKYHGLDLICRDASKLDTFIELANDPPKPKRGKPPAGYVSWEAYDAIMDSMQGELR